MEWHFCKGSWTSTKASRNNDSNPLGKARSATAYIAQQSTIMHEVVLGYRVKALTETSVL